MDDHCAGTARRPSRSRRASTLLWRRNHSPAHKNRMSVLSESHRCVRGYVVRAIRHLIQEVPNKQRIGHTHQEVVDAVQEHSLDRMLPHVFEHALGFERCIHASTSVTHRIPLSYGPSQSRTDLHTRRHCHWERVPTTRELHESVAAHEDRRARARGYPYRRFALENDLAIRSRCRHGSLSKHDDLLGLQPEEVLALEEASRVVVSRVARENVPHDTVSGLASYASGTWIER